VAVSRAYGPEEALQLVDELADALRGYHLLPAVRADLLLSLRRYEEARRAFEEAARLATNLRERALLLGRAASCVRPSALS